MTSSQAVPEDSSRGLGVLSAVLRREFAGFGRNVASCGLLTGFSAVLEIAIAFLIAGLSAAIIKQTSQFELPFSIEVTTRQAALASIAAVLLRALVDYVAVAYRFAFIERYENQARAGLLVDFLDAEWSLQSAEDAGSVQTTTVNFLDLAKASLGRVMDSVTAITAFLLMVGASVLAGGLWVVVILAGSVALALLLRPLVAMSHDAGKRYRTSQLEFIRTIGEVYSMAREIRLFGATGHSKAQVERTTAALAESNRRGAVSQSVLASAQASSVYLVACIGFLLLVSLDVKDPEPYVVVVMLVYRGLMNGRVFQASYQALVSALPSLQSLQAKRAHYRDARLVDSGLEFEPPLSSIEFDDVGFTYPEGSTALVHASFSIAQGEALGLVGPSGSGKSTIVQLMLRLRLPTSGQIRVNGRDLAELRPGSWFGRTVLVPQEAQVFRATVIDNVTSFRPHITREAAIDALRRAHVLDEVLALPDGLDTLLGEDGRTLSGGQRQRVCIARALAGTPDVLILDEPTSALDLISEEGIRATLEELRGSVTIVIIAHRLSTLRVCDRVMVLQDGHIEATGNRSELEARGGFYAQAVELAKLV